MNFSFKTLQRVCAKTACSLALALFSVLFLSSLSVTAHLCKQSWAHETIAFSHDSVAVNLLLTLLMFCAIILIYKRLKHFSSIKLSVSMLIVWGLGTLVLVVGANIVQLYDFAYVQEAAELFARGNYKPLTIDYFNVYSYQLGICLPMEFIKRLISKINLSLFMQVINVFLSAGIAGILTFLSCILFSNREAKATLIMCVFFLPLMMQCIFVYGTLPMLFFVSAAILFLTLYLKKRKLHFGFLFSLCISVAYMLKPNAAIPLMALVICALLDMLTSRDLKLLSCVILSIPLALAMQKLSILQYELRAGITLSENVSMLARLVMGLQRGNISAGWFNGYTEQFFPFTVTAEQEYAIASADLAARLAEMKADPAMTLAFFKDKLLSQWLEPSYGAMWYGDLCEHTGPLQTATKAFFADGGRIRIVLERFMGAYQKGLYLLMTVGLVHMIREKMPNLSALTLPVCAIGGCLYHMIFEAKAQYMYPYVLLMMPIAAHGLCTLYESLACSKRITLSRKYLCK